MVVSKGAYVFLFFIKWAQAYMSVVFHSIGDIAQIALFYVHLIDKITH